MRTPLLLLILLSFLMQGMLPLHGNQNHCPRHDSGVVMDDMDCCNDPQTAAQTGQLCKADRVCATVTVSMANPMAHSEIAVGTERIALRLSWPPLAQPLATIWRPPALI